MQLVRMRRPTKIMVMKNWDGARVLRSGRRLWPDYDGTKLHKTDDGWLHITDDTHMGDTASNLKATGCHHPVDFERNNVVAMDVDAESKSPEYLNMKLDLKSIKEKKWGSVYQRKRKRRCEKIFSGLKAYRSSENALYGKFYVRKLRRKIVIPIERNRLMLAVVVDSHGDESSWFIIFLCSVFDYMMRARVTIRELSAFLLTGVLHDVFSSHGIYFSRVLPSSGSGICKFFGASHSVPLFSIDFSAVPSCFLYIQLDALLRSRYHPLIGMDSNTEMETNDDANIPSISMESCGIKSLVFEEVDPVKGNVFSLNFLDSKAAAPKTHRRNGFKSFKFKTKRRSMRLTRLRSSSSLSIHNENGYIVPSTVRTRRRCRQLSTVVSGRRHRNFALKNSIKESKSVLDSLREDVYTTCCSANLLICEPNRSQHEERVNIFMELSSLKQWVLAVKRNGSVIYTHVAQNFLQPCPSNRFTHTMVWASEDGWKLEFPNREDWFIFKELYKRCCDLNVQAPSPKLIPVPGVWEVSDYDDVYSTSFVRPDSYIHINDDEVSRAMARKSPIYDMDSEDEDWLNKFNNAVCAMDEYVERVSIAKCELLIDSFEKARFCFPDEDYSEENVGIHHCLDMEKRNVVEAVYRYWMRKRTQRFSAIVRIFQQQQQQPLPRKAQPLPIKTVSRKRRSFKRQTTNSTRNIQRLLTLQAASAEQDAAEEEDARRKVEEARKRAKDSMESAIGKRRRAQMLMEYADLVTFRATIALRIAEAAPVAHTTEAAADAFLDD